MGKNRGLHEIAIDEMPKHIVSDKRKKFLLAAVNSVLNQTLNDEYYEIIVIKNFKDDEINKKLGQSR